MKGLFKILFRIWLSVLPGLSAIVPAPAVAPVATTAVTVAVSIAMPSCSKGQITETFKVSGKVKFKYQDEVTPAPGSSNDTAYLLAFLGQSNTPGRVDTSSIAAPYLHLLGRQDSVLIRRWIEFDSAHPANPIHQDSGFQPMHAGVNTSDVDLDGRFGSQVFLGVQLAETIGRQVYIFQGAQGGTSINIWTQAVRDMYKYCDSASASVNTYFAAQGRPVKWLAAIWIQGESNGSTDTTTYKGYLDSVLILSREWTGNATLPFFHVQMINCQTGVSNLSRLQTCQQTWANVNATNGVYFFPASGGPNSCWDNLHFGYTKHADLAGDFYTQLMAIYPWLDD